jgi:hypothetical protein
MLSKKSVSSQTREIATPSFSEIYSPKEFKTQAMIPSSKNIWINWFLSDINENDTYNNLGGEYFYILNLVKFALQRPPFWF